MCRLIPLDTLPLKTGKLWLLMSPETFAAFSLSTFVCETCVILLERSVSSNPSTSDLETTGGDVDVLLFQALTTEFFRLPSNSMNLN